MKKTIVHIIDTLGLGGAEVMLVKLLKELPEYNNIVVTLNAKNQFNKDKAPSSNFYCLNMGRFSNFLLAAIRLRRILKSHKVDLVHSHLFAATLIARLGTHKYVPLISTIHTNVASSEEYKKWYMRPLEKLGYRMHYSTIIGVSKAVLKEYYDYFNHKPQKSHLLYNFAAISPSKPLISKREYTAANPFLITSVGALRYPKNHQYLIKALALIKNKPVQLHIYGGGKQEGELQALIKETGANVILKGEVPDVSSLLPQYDCYTMSSEFEGFSLSVLEAMAAQIPLLLSDNVSFREQCEDTALYFELKSINDYVTKLELLMSDIDLQNKLAVSARQRMMNNFTLQNHLTTLKGIYSDTINNNHR